MHHKLPSMLFLSHLGLFAVLMHLTNTSSLPFHHILHPIISFRLVKFSTTSLSRAQMSFITHHHVM